MADACVTVQVYGEYKASLAFDLVSSRQKNVRKSELQTHTSSVYSINDIVLTDYFYTFWVEALSH